MKIVNEKELMDRIKQLILEDGQDLRWNFVDGVGLDLEVVVENDIGNTIHYQMEVNLSEYGDDD